MCDLKYVSYDYCRYICRVTQTELHSPGDLHVLHGTNSCDMQNIWSEGEVMCNTLSQQ